MLRGGVTVSQSGANVVITSTIEGVEYVLSGTTTAGSLKIYSDYKFKLNFNGVDITSTSGPAMQYSIARGVLPTYGRNW